MSGSEDSSSARSGSGAEIRPVRFEANALLAALWRGKWFIAAITSAFALIAAIVAFWLPDQYEAKVLLMPASSSSNSSLARLAGQFGGLASLAGINVGGDAAGDKARIAVELIKTWDFLDRFIRENEIEVHLLAVEGWDRKSNDLIINPKIYDARARKWTNQLDSEGGGGEPGRWELYQELKNRISVSEQKDTGLITLGVTYYSPDIAKDWVDKLVAAVNKHLRSQDQRDARKSIEYLQKQISDTNLTEMKNIFYSLIEEQTKNLMLAEASEEYAWKVLSPAKTPEEKSKPSRLVICLLASFLGALVAVFIWIVFLFERDVTVKMKAPGGVS